MESITPRRKRRAVPPLDVRAWRWTQRHPGAISAAISVLGVLASGVSLVASLLITPEGISPAALTVAISAAAVAILAQSFTAIRRSRAEAGVVEERATMQTAFNNALAPVTQHISILAMAKPPTARRAMQYAVVQHICSTLLVLFPAAGHARAVVYYHDPGTGPSDERLLRYLSHGRADLGRDVIDRSDARGRSTLDWFHTDSKVWFIDDAKTREVEGYDAATAKYKTFIRARIEANGESLGILCVDAPFSGTLDDSDSPTVVVLALLIGLATVTAKR